MVSTRPEPAKRHAALPEKAVSAHNGLAGHAQDFWNLNFELAPMRVTRSGANATQEFQGH
jgi:hypothetical protein